MFELRRQKSLHNFGKLIKILNIKTKKFFKNSKKFIRANKIELHNNSWKATPLTSFNVRQYFEFNLTKFKFRICYLVDKL